MPFQKEVIYCIYSKNYAKNIIISKLLYIKDFIEFAFQNHLIKVWIIILLLIGNIFFNNFNGRFNYIHRFFYDCHDARSIISDPTASFP